MGTVCVETRQHRSRASPSQRGSTREAGDRALQTNRSAQRYVQRPPTTASGPPPHCGGEAQNVDVSQKLPHRSGIERPENSTVCCFQRDGAEAGPWRSTREAGDRALQTNRSARRYVQDPHHRKRSLSPGAVLTEDLFRRFAPPSPKGKASPPDCSSGVRTHCGWGGREETLCRFQSLVCAIVGMGVLLTHNGGGQPQEENG